MVFLLVPSLTSMVVVSSCNAPYLSFIMCNRKKKCGPALVVQQVSSRDSHEHNSHLLKGVRLMVEILSHFCEQKHWVLVYVLSFMYDFTFHVNHYLFLVWYIWFFGFTFQRTFFLPWKLFHCWRKPRISKLIKYAWKNKHYHTFSNSSIPGIEF